MGLKTARWKPVKTLDDSKYSWKQGKLTQVPEEEVKILFLLSSNPAEYIT